MRLEIGRDVPPGDNGAIICTAFYGKCISALAEFDTDLVESLAGL